MTWMSGYLKISPFNGSKMITSSVADPYISLRVRFTQLICCSLPVQVMNECPDSASNRSIPAIVPAIYCLFDPAQIINPVIEQCRFVVWGMPVIRYFSCLQIQHINTSQKVPIQRLPLRRPGNLDAILGDWIRLIRICSEYSNVPFSWSKYLFHRLQYQPDSILIVNPECIYDITVQITVIVGSALNYGMPVYFCKQVEATAVPIQVSPGIVVYVEYRIICKTPLYPVIMFKKSGYSSCLWIYIQSPAFLSSNVEHAFGNASYRFGPFVIG